MNKNPRGKSLFYADGWHEGYDAFDVNANDPDILKAWEEDALGEIVSQIFQQMQRMAGTIYYDDSVTEKQLEAWEEGFLKGFEAGAEETWGKGRIGEIPV